MSTRQLLTEQWAEAKESLLEGVAQEKREYVAQLMENTRQAILTEDAAVGAVAANDIAGFRKILIPMIRRIIPGTIATELVGVQPMDGPVGLAYTMRYKYGENVRVPAAGQDGNPWTANPSTNFGNINAGDEAFGNNPVLRQYYSGGAWDGTGPAGTDGQMGQVPGASGISASGIAKINGDATRGGWSSSMPSYNSTRFNDGDQTSGFGPDALGQSYSGSLYGGSGSYIEGSGGRTMQLEVVSQAVEARTRKLQAGWTVEAMQDLKNQHGFDMETELTRVVSAEITQEIDSEILSDLIALAGTAMTYDHAQVAATGYQPAFLGDRFANLGIYIQNAANEIARKTRRGPGNFIVVSPMVVTILQAASKSVFAPAVQGSFKGPNNSMLVGTLNGQIKVYSYLWNQVFQSGVGSSVNDTILVGYKGGNGETDSGYFYCPYIPLMNSGTVINPVTYQPQFSLMTRYGKAAFTSTATSLGNSSDYYAKIALSNFEFA